MWNGRSSSWHEHVNSSPAFESIRQAAIDASAASDDDEVVDLGAGTGFLTLTVARAARHVIAVDLSAEMLHTLETEAIELGLTNIEVALADLSDFDLAPHSVDLVISGYAMHHLRDVDKSAVIERAYDWLRPGGRLVVVDMMFGRGTTADDRKIIWTKVKRLAKRGPGGLWRIAKNLVRFGLHRGTELPVPPAFWIAALQRRGFVDVEFVRLVAEAGLISARKP